MATPREKGHTSVMTMSCSSSRRSLIPAHTPAPSATILSGSAAITGRADISLSRKSLNTGMREEPPTRTTWRIPLAALLFSSARRSTFSTRLKTGAHSSASKSRLNCSPYSLPPAHSLITALSASESSSFAFWAWRVSSALSSGDSASRDSPFALQKCSATAASISSPPRRLSPAMPRISIIFSKHSTMLTSSVPPPKSTIISLPSSASGACHR